jgi:hypothetical protein
VQTAQPQTEKKFDVLEVAAMHGPEQSPKWGKYFCKFT